MPRVGLKKYRGMYSFHDELFFIFFKKKNVYNRLAM